MKQFTIIDAYGFLFRAYYVMPNLTTSQGVPVGGLYGFINMMLKYIGSTDYLTVVFDTGKQNFRHQMYPDYKANRPKPPENLIPQFSLLREAVKALNVSYEEIAGFEADDVIASLSDKFSSSHDMKVVVVSADKDLWQLMLNGSQIYDPIKNKHISQEDVVAKFGVPVEKLLDLLSLTGDVSDNIPGVPSIGVKTAAKLLHEYSSLETLLQNADQIKQEKCRSVLQQYHDQAILSKQLLTLREDVKVGDDIEKYKVSPPDKTSLLSFLTRYEFKSLIARVEKQFQFTESEAPAVVTQTADEKTLKDFVRYCQETGVLAIYQQQNSLSLASIGGMNIVVPDIVLALSVIQPLIVAKSVRKIVYNLKDLYNLIPCLAECPAEDVMIMSYSVAGAPLDAGTKETAQTLISLFGELSDRIITNKVSTIYHRFDLPLAAVLHAMEKIGVLVDIKVLHDLSAKFTGKLQDLELKIYRFAGQEFNIASPKQLGDILFGKMQLKQGKKLKSGGYSTDVKVLEELAANGVDIADRILKWRHFHKLKTTYTDALVKQVAPQTGRIHTTYSAVTTSTGRLSSSNPNLQNIPIRSAEGVLIRRAFIARDGHQLISADYSQIELRLIAHIGDVKAFKEAFKAGQDVHALTAKQIFGSSDTQFRYRAKAINFGIIYGISAFGLARQLGINRIEAAEYINGYFSRYPEIRLYMEDMKLYARKNGYVQTLFGRKCFLSDINSSNSHLRNFSERFAINAPLQGTAADIIKRSMIHLYPLLPAEAKIILQVHDELLIEAPNHLVNTVAELTKKTMEAAASLSVPMEVDVHIGQNWGEMFERKGLDL